jgi:hypothetical protein
VIRPAGKTVYAKEIQNDILANSTILQHAVIGSIDIGKYNIRGDFLSTLERLRLHCLNAEY